MDWSAEIQFSIQCVGKEGEVGQRKSFFFFDPRCEGRGTAKLGDLGTDDVGRILGVSKEGSAGQG